MPKDGGIDVSLVNMSPGDSTILESTLVFTLRYQNSMPEPVTITGSSHKVFIEGTYVGEALSHDEVAVPQFGSSTQEAVAHLQNYALAMTLVTTVTKQPTVHYEIRSTIYAKRGSLNLKFSQTKSDTLNLSELENRLNNR